MSLNYNNLKNKPTFSSVLKIFEDYLLFQKINCCRVGIVEEYDNTTRVAKVIIANKLTTKTNKDGTQITQNYAPIYAKVLFIGWSNSGITYPITAGTEGLLLFSDREIESWYVNGNVNPLANLRKHDKTDAIFIAGLLSLPNMQPTDTAAVNIFNENVKLKVYNDSINANTTLTANKLIDLSGASGSFISKDDKTITVENGIITGIN